MRETAVVTGADEALVADIGGKLLRAEYKRRQPSPGVKIGTRNSVATAATRLPTPSTPAISLLRSRQSRGVTHVPDCSALVGKRSR